MKVDLRYLGRTEVRALPAGLALSFAPNLARPPVFFDAELVRPVRFREAVSALHEVVLGDLRLKKKDRTQYLEWKKERDQEEREIRQRVFKEAEKVELAKIAREPIPAGLQEGFQEQHRIYWDARRQWASELQRNDPELFRALVPCDPVVTVAPDVVFFECFSKDESSYGCLTVDRAAFRDETVAGLGTTNVDYSLALFEHFQTLRSYRPTRLLVDPTGFEVKVGDRMDYREEKIDLPPSWLRGFGQLQAAMTLPARRVEISIEALYSVLAYLKRHREKTGPRSVRFRLVPGESPVLYLDPWGIPIPSRAAAFDGERPEEIKVWGRRRLMTLARVLPLSERIEVALLGSGLPSFWVLHMGEMAFVLALSGWTANDWTSASNLEAMVGAYRAEPETVEAIARYLEQSRSATIGALAIATGAPRETLLGSLNLLAKQGQVVFDHGRSCYRFRPLMPVALSEAVIGPEHPEVVAGRRIKDKIRILREEALTAGRRLLVAKAGDTSCEGILDADGRFTRAKCSCSYFYKNRLRAGPCRHLLGLRLFADPATRMGNA